MMDSGGELKDVATIIGTVGYTGALAPGALPPALVSGNRSITSAVSLVATVTLAVISVPTMWSSTLWQQ